MAGTLSPSSPSMALFKDGELVTMIERHQIENHNAEQVAGKLIEAFKQYCDVKSKAAQE